MDGSVHTVLVEEEQVAFADWINDMFSKDPDVNHKLPLKKDGSDMYEKMDDGILLCKVINKKYNVMVMVIMVINLFHPDHQPCCAGHNRRACDQQRKGGSNLQAA